MRYWVRMLQTQIGYDVSEGGLRLKHPTLYKKGTVCEIGESLFQNFNACGACEILTEENQTTEIQPIKNTLRLNPSARKKKIIESMETKA